MGYRPNNRKTLARKAPLDPRGARASLPSSFGTGNHDTTAHRDVIERENDDLEWDVNLRTLEGDNLKWVNWEEEDDEKRGEETEVLKVATVPDAAITEISFSVNVL
ncbi:hypothetical protein Bca4012_025103 [Brassica carinata]